jgi:hypothetical protein
MQASRRSLRNRGCAARRRHRNRGHFVVMAARYNGARHFRQPDALRRRVAPGSAMPPTFSRCR